MSIFSNIIVKRFIATFIDLVVLLGLIIGMLVVYMRIVEGRMPENASMDDIMDYTLSTDEIAVILITALFLIILYIIIPLIFKGSTLGKVIMGLYITYDGNKIMSFSMLLLKYAQYTLAGIIFYTPLSVLSFIIFVSYYVVSILTMDKETGNTLIERKLNLQYNIVPGRK